MIFNDDTCALCSQPKKHTASTTFSGGYCIDCLHLVLWETQEAISDLEEVGEELGK